MNEMGKDLIFENTTKLTKKLFFEYKKYMYNKKLSMYRILLLTMSIILFLAATLVIITNGKFIISFYYMVIIQMLLYFNLYAIHASIEFKQLKGMHKWVDDYIEYKYEFYNDNFKVNVSGVQLELNYKRITELYVTKDTIILLDETTPFIIHIRNLTLENGNTLEEFLKKKCINIAQRPKKYMKTTNKAILFLLSIIVGICVVFTGFSYIKTYFLEKQSSDIVFYKVVENENGLIEIVLPENLFGSLNKTAKSLKATLISNKDWEDDYTNIVANEDGTLSYLYTRAQYEAVKKELYKQAISLENYKKSFSGLGFISVKEIVFDNKELTHITVIMSPEDALLPPDLDKKIIGLIIALKVGEYQVHAGANFNEWHTTIVFANSTKDEIISEGVYPNKSMYTLN